MCLDGRYPPPPPANPVKQWKIMQLRTQQCDAFPLSNFVFGDVKLMPICDVYVCVVTRSNNLLCVFLAKVK